MTAVVDPALIESLPGGDLALRGWRCDSCGRLALASPERCPVCGARGGRTTHLGRTARLQTWSRVMADPPYIVGYALAGDGEDDQEVRVFGPLAVDDEGRLRVGQQVAIGFRTGVTTRGRERAHHYFAPESEAGA
jgi:uncharacterized OB-fold protein